MPALSPNTPVSYTSISRTPSSPNHLRTSDCGPAPNHASALGDCATLYYIRTPQPRRSALSAVCGRLRAIPSQSPQATLSRETFCERAIAASPTSADRLSGYAPLLQICAMIQKRPKSTSGGRWPWIPNTHQASAPTRCFCSKGQ
jgi:hypothetical protein